MVLCNLGFGVWLRTLVASPRQVTFVMLLAERYGSDPR
jgi:hypothetical protein